jgi:copper chaperone CopZ
VKNPKSAEMLFTRHSMGISAVDGKPVIKLWMNHMCCTGCLSDVTKALEAIPGIKVRQLPLKSQEQADKEESTAKEFANQVELEVASFRTIDFMQIDRALRDAGLVADRIEVSGPRHFRLEATLKHVCCGLCGKGVKEGLEVARGLKAQQHFRWLDSFTVVKEKKLVVAHARYDAVADVVEYMHGLNQAGFEASSMYVVVDKEGGADPNQ